MARNKSLDLGQIGFLFEAAGGNPIRLSELKFSLRAAAAGQGDYDLGAEDVDVVPTEAILTVLLPAPMKMSKDRDLDVGVRIAVLEWRPPLAVSVSSRWDHPNHRATRRWTVGECAADALHDPRPTAG